MKRLKLLLLTCLLCFPFGVLAKAESCNYQDGTGSTVVSAVTDDGFLARATVKVTKYKGNSMNKNATLGVNSVKLTKCFKYMRLFRNSTNNFAYEFHYQVSDSETALTGSSTDQGVLLTLNGESYGDTSQKSCNNYYMLGKTSSTDTLDFKVKRLSSISFNFFTYADGSRVFCVNYDNTNSCSEKFTGTSVPTVKTNIANGTSDSSSFTIASSSINGFFGSPSCVRDEQFNIKKQGDVYRLITRYDTAIEDAANDPKGNIEVTDVGFCDPVQSNGVLKAFQVIGYIIYVAKFLIPLLLIIFGSIDFAKAIISSSDKAGSEAISSFVKRVVAAVIIFFVPTIISFVLDLIDDASATINDENFTNCKTCLFDPLSKECLAQNIVDDK